MQPKNIIGFIDGYKGTKLYYSFYQVPESRARIIFLHGAGEYSEKYTRFAEWFKSEDIEVGLLDLRGHGRSGGPRCHIDDFNDYALDLDITIKFFEKNYDAKNIFLVSHSLGGLIAIYYSINFHYSLRGIVSCSPCLGLRLKVEPIKGWLANVFYPVLKNIPFSTRIKPKMATHDISFIERFRGDPFIRHTVTASFYVQMAKAMRYVRSHADRFSAPILILQAGADKICDPKAAENFCKIVNSRDSEFKLYEGFYHEILNEQGKEKAFGDIYNWIKARCE